ncbi:MAG: hypothetical protein IKR04_00910 [Clostridia bacterium]|nr:hypothetical protein [Clostridia bacterium]
MALVRFMGKHWGLVANAIKTEILRQNYIITRTKHQILRLPIQRIETNGTLDEKIAELKKIIIADCEYKAIHHDAEVQGNKTLEELEDIKQQFFDLENKISDTTRVIEKYKELQYFIEAASKKPDTVFDKDVHIPAEKAPFTGDWGIFSDEEKELCDKID